MYPSRPSHCVQFAKATQQNSEKHSTYQITGLLQKDVTQEQSGGRDAQGKIRGKGMELPRLLQVWHSPDVSVCAPTLKLSEPSHLGFQGGFIT